MRRIAIALVATLFLAGCGPAQKLADFGKVITQTIVNPAGPVDIYRIKNVYAATLQAFVDYRAYCWARPYRALIADPIAGPVCRNRRDVVRVVQEKRPQVRKAIDVADNFVRRNPTLSAATVLDEAWAAVNAFRSLVPVAK